MGKYFFKNHSSLLEIKHTSCIYHTIMLTETKVKSIDGGKMIRKIIRIDKENAMAAAPVQMPATKVPLISLMEKQNW